MQLNKSYVEADWSVGNVVAPIAMNHHRDAGLLQIVITGTIDLTIQASNSDLQGGATASWAAYSTDSTAVTASKIVQMPTAPRFLRFLVNSFTAGATVTLNYVQSDV